MMPGMPGGPQPAPPSPVPPGGTSPATVAPDSQGLQMRGRIQASLGMKALTQALGLLGADTDEGKTVIEALAKLSKTFGEASADLSRQEVKLMGEKIAPVQQPTEAQGAAFGKLASMGMRPPQGAPASPAPPTPSQPPPQPMAA